MEETEAVMANSVANSNTAVAAMVAAAEEMTIATIINTVKKDLNNCSY
jgi:hypothetical protein